MDWLDLIHEMSVPGVRAVPQVQCLQATAWSLRWSRLGLPHLPASETGWPSALGPAWGLSVCLCPCICPSFSVPLCLFVHMPWVLHEVCLCPWVCPPLSLCPFVLGPAWRLAVCPCVCPSVSVPLFFCLSMCLGSFMRSVSLSLYLSLWFCPPSVSLSICLGSCMRSVSLSLHPRVCPSVLTPSVSLSVRVPWVLHEVASPTLCLSLCYVSPLSLGLYVQVLGVLHEVCPSLSQSLCLSFCFISSLSVCPSMCLGSCMRSVHLSDTMCLSLHFIPLLSVHHLSDILCLLLCFCPPLSHCVVCPCACVLPVICPSVCLICPSVHPSALGPAWCLCVCPAVCLSVLPSFYPTFCPFVCLSVQLSFYQMLFPGVCRCCVLVCPCHTSSRCLWRLCHCLCYIFSRCL